MNLLKFSIALSVCLCTLHDNCLAQAPLPGAPTPGVDNAAGVPNRPPVTSPVAPPAGGQPGQVFSPIPGNGATVNYKKLPINYQGAAVRLEELRNLMPNIRAKEFQDMINDYLEWVGDLADGHWRLYQSFAKIDTMKDRAETEKQTTLKLGSLKRQAMLLKAEFLIKENRHPEALQPLVEIVVAEPKTQTGDSAYVLLKQIGFSEEPVAMPVSAVAPKPVESAPPVIEAKPPLRSVGRSTPR